jgi:hypothetical protein
VQIPSQLAHTIYHTENNRLRLQERMETYWPDVDAKVVEENDDSWENKLKHMEKKYKPVEWKLLKVASNGGYHYHLTANH